MSRADFYILESTGDQNRQAFACKLTEKAYRSGLRTYLRVASPQEAARLNDLLWTFRQGSFVPHALTDEPNASAAPVTIGVALPAAGDHPPDILINLSEHLPDTLDQFERIIEVVDNEAERRQAARERYRQYRNQGFQVETHTITLDGKPS